MTLAATVQLVVSMVKKKSTFFLQYTARIGFGTFTEAVH